MSARFLLIVEGLGRAAAARLGVRGADRDATGRLMLLLWSRLQRLKQSFATLRATYRFQPFQPFRPFAPLGRTLAAPLADAAPRHRQHLPRGFGWLVRLVPEAACYGSQLRHLMSEAEMAALLAASPQARRLLRPLCRMLAVEPPRASQAKPPTDPPACDAAPAPPPPAVRRGAVRRGAGWPTVRARPPAIQPRFARA